MKTGKQRRLRRKNYGGISYMNGILKRLYACETLSKVGMRKKIRYSKSILSVLKPKSRG
jgi:hypothetical protein